MNKIGKFIKNHPLLFFFIFTFLLSWLMFIIALTLIPENELYRAPFITVGAFAPALVSILLSRSKKKREKKERSKRSVTFVVTWVIAFLNILLFSLIIRDFAFDVIIIIVAAFLALLPAFVLSSVYSKDQGIRKHLKTLLKPKGSGGFYVLALTGIPIVLLLGAVITQLINGSIPDPMYSIQDAGLSMVFLMIFLTFMSHLINSGGLAEEPGWRGFALKRMQMKLSPLLAGIIIGFIWALWHIPVMMAQVQALGLIIVTAQVLQLGITFTWLYNRTQGSLLSVAMLHASWNTGGSFIPRTQAFYIIMTLLMIIMVFSDRMWKRNQ
jgi:membrane protease YdiL (CAAX protease family)